MISNNTHHLSQKWDCAGQTANTYVPGELGKVYSALIKSKGYDAWTRSDELGKLTDPCIIRRFKLIDNDAKISAFLAAKLLPNALLLLSGLNNRDVRNIIVNLYIDMCNRVELFHERLELEHSQLPSDFFWTMARRQEAPVQTEHHKNFKSKVSKFLNFK